MSEKLLNLDELKPDVLKTVVVDGERHEMRSLSVGEFIDVMRRLDEMKDKPITPDQEMRLMIDMIATSFPSLKRERIEGMSLAHIQAITNFVRESNSETVAKAVEEGVEGK